MDQYELRALELEKEQAERFEGCTRKNFWDDFERQIKFQIDRYRRVSSTYKTPASLD